MFVLVNLGRFLTQGRGSHEAEEMGAGERRKEQKANTGRSTKKTSRGKKETEGEAQRRKKAA